MPDMKTLTVGENTYTVVDGSAVHFTEQTLTAEQRAQARKNIGIYSGTEIPSDWQEGDIFIDTDGGSQTVNLMENASVAVGAPGLITENVPNLSYYTEAAYSRATLNPLYFYAESGTLNVSLSDYSVYQFTVYCYSCDESAKDVDFSFTEGTIKYFEMNSSKVYESGWKTADFSLEINGTCLIALMFRRQDDANLDSADTAQIKTLLTATVTRTDDGSAESPEDTYELPIATADTLGGVKPVQKTEDMTQSVGVDEFGGLWTAPGGVSSDAWELIADITLEEQVTSFSIDEDMGGEPFSLRKYLLAYAWAQVTDGSTIPSYMFLVENNRQYGESQPPLYTGAFNVASATGKTAGVIIAELLPNNVISEECWTTSVDASISLEPFQPIKGPMPNTYKNKVFKQDSNFAPFYQIGGSNGVLAAGSRIMLWGVRK